MKLLGLAVFLCFILSTVKSAEPDDIVILNDIAARGVSSSIPPSAISKGPTIVNISMYLQTLYLKTDERAPTLEAIFFLRESWMDPRLAFLNITTNQNRSVPFSSSNFQVWHPDSFFVNDHDAQPLEEGDYLSSFHRVYPTGLVFFSIHQKRSFTCSMNWAKYPFDTQECPFTIESYGYSTKDVVYAFPNIKSPVWFDKIETDIDPEYNLGVITALLQVQKFSVGSFSKMSVVIPFIRVKNYVLELFFAPALFIMLSWPIALMSSWLTRGPYMVASLLLFFLLFGVGIFQSFTLARDSIVMTYMSMCGTQLTLELITLLIVGYLADRYNLTGDKSVAKPDETEAEGHQVTHDDVQQLFSNNIEQLVNAKISNVSLARIQLFTTVGFVGFFVLWQIIFWACLPYAN